MTFDQLNDRMASMGVEQFSYETFTAIFDSDPRIKKIVKNFNQEQIDFVQDSVDALPQGEPDADVVGQMAQNATDVGANL
jgi:hypothetical protein